MTATDAAHRTNGTRRLGVTSAYDGSELAPFSDLVIGSIADLDVENLRRLVH